MISLFGYGRTMQSLARLLCPCNIYDDKFKTASVDNFGNNLLPSSVFDPNQSKLEIVSPGIPPYSPMVKFAKNVISDYDYFYPNNAFNIWISGTNGKTTTTEMTQLLLSDYGSLCGGNIGTPICDLDLNARIWILETSSFTLHYIKRANPNIYALLPVTSDHLEWHGNFDQYLRAKLKPLDLMGGDSIAIIPSMYADLCNGFKGRVYYYSSAFDLANAFNIDINNLKFKGPFLLDSVMALGISSLVSHNIDYNKINSYKIGEHRLEEIHDKHGRLFVNDSKATNINATLEALKLYEDKKIYLILGGDSKGVNLEPLIVRLKQYNVIVFCIGLSSASIHDLCSQYAIESRICNNLEDAVSIIKRLLNCNEYEVCLLSPACASLDQFKSYQHRGEVFKRSIFADNTH